MARRNSKNTLQREKLKNSPQYTSKTYALDYFFLEDFEHFPGHDYQVDVAMGRRIKNYGKELAN